MTVIVNNKEEMNGRRMNFIREGIKIHHTIINIPSNGVYLGVCVYMYIYYIYLFISFLFFFFLNLTQFSTYSSLFTLSFTSLRKLHIPPSCVAGDEKKCVGYDFEGGFYSGSLNHRDENGEEIPNIKDYYENRYEEEEEDDGEEGEEEEEDEEEEN
jgi:hypothetical protein